MKFTKMQGAGNDFIVIEANAEAHDWPRLAAAMCNRHYGIGADGILIMSPSKVADLRMRVFNSDGSEAEACGNGTRCIVRYFVDRKPGNTHNREISVETMAGIRNARVHRTAKLTKIKVDMGKPGFAEKEIPVLLKQCDQVNTRKPMITCSLQIDRRELALSLVSMGNPHAVYFTDKPVADFPLAWLGPKMEHHQMFPAGTNFEVARIINRKQIEARVWERGSGETLACGTGACATAVAARLHGYIDDNVAVKLPGGVLEIEWTGTGNVSLSGPAETIFTGEWPEGNID